MKRSFLLLVVPALLVVGCKNRESQLVGAWQAGGQTLDIKADKTWSQTGVVKVDGTWSFADPKVTLVIKTINGQDPKAFAKTAIGMLKSSPMAAKLGGDKVEKQLSELDKPQSATLSEDGKSLMVANPMSGGTVTLTKGEAAK